MCQSITDGQLLNLCTVRHVMAALEPDWSSPTGWFKHHPLHLPLYEGAEARLDYTGLDIEMPVKRPRRHQAEGDDILLPLAVLCEKAGPKMSGGSWNYRWYYLELLDRDRRVTPVCWVTPRLLCQHFPEEPLEASEFVEPDYESQLAYMDDICWRDRPDRKQHEWREWLVRTWRKHEAEWKRDGQIRYKRVQPWSSMLRYSTTLGGGSADYGSGGLPFRSPMERWFAEAGYTGMYWQMVPLYDRQDLSAIWSAMLQDLYITSVFSPSAAARQERGLWDYLESRFPLRRERVARRRERIARREQKVFEWTDDGKTLDDIAKLMMDEGIYPLDPLEAYRFRSLSKEERAPYADGARAVAIRIRRRLRERGLLTKLPPGRRKRKPNGKQETDEDDDC